MVLLQNVVIAANTSYVRLGEVSGITMTMDYGSRMDVSTSWGDGHAEQENYIDVQLVDDEVKWWSLTDVTE